ncbi:uncharacterized protein VTP21DRAFT_3627 [Calcarisporiella thermophila]|uniref:uncharacterized protein n=1 Tax=Calcarisporiella thermophila TaxID=911321 RepID=UPI0037430990
MPNHSVAAKTLNDEEEKAKDDSDKYSEVPVASDEEKIEKGVQWEVFHETTEWNEADEENTPPSTNGMVADKQYEADENSLDEETSEEMVDTELDELHFDPHDAHVDLDALEKKACIQATKDVFTSPQRVAYVALCYVTCLELVFQSEGNYASYARMSADKWHRNLMRKLYAHMELNEAEQRMIEQLSKHQVTPRDLVQNFISKGETTTLAVDVLNDVVSQEKTEVNNKKSDEKVREVATSDQDEIPLNDTETLPGVNKTEGEENKSENVLVATKPKEPTDEPATVQELCTSPRPSSSTSSSSISALNEEYPPSSVTSSSATSNAKISLAPLIVDLRWTVLCDLFLLCVSDSAYDARSRVLISRIGHYLGLDFYEIQAFEHRIMDQLQLDDVGEPEGGDMGNNTEMQGRNKQNFKRRVVMVGLATVGGGLVLGLSAGLLAPVIGAGLGAVLGTVGISGTSAFLGGTSGVALITSGAALAGSGIASRKMARRTKGVDTFDFLTVRDNHRANAIITIAGWVAKEDDFIRPFSTIDPVLGDHFSISWEPEMLIKLGSLFSMLVSELLSNAVQQALRHTMMGALVSALAFPLALTKLGYLIDNPWNNALDRARIAGLILADSLLNRNLGSRPITLIGYSLGARVIFFALLELARVNAFGIVEDVYLFGAPLSATKDQWRQCTTVVAGRFVNGYVRNDWVLGFLFRASTSGLNSVAGIRPIAGVTRISNIDCTDLVKGHLHYRICMPKLLQRAGIRVTSETIPTPNTHLWTSVLGRRRDKDEDDDSINARVEREMQKIRDDLEAQGVEVREIESTLPPLVLEVDEPQPLPEKPTLAPPPAARFFS